ncbi:hypothetical protein I4U23_010005 [Adineta vaga]|nr:hypothetical protein I4U23_010005 [Adineta vaga]
MESDKISNPHAVMFERLYTLNQSIHILNLVNNDLQKILHKHKPLPHFICDALKRSTISKSKTSPALPSAAAAAAAAPPLPPPTESEEMRLAASIIDKAKRTIENVGEKKPKPSSTVTVPIATTVQTNRPKTTSSTRPSSASSTTPTPSTSSTSQQPTQPSVRRYVPAHVKAPFLTQPEKKRRPNSAFRNSTQTNLSQRTSTTHRSLSQQQRLSSADIPQQVTHTPPTPSEQPIENRNVNNTNQKMIASEPTSIHTTTEEPIHVYHETIDTDISSIPQPIILNRALIKPLRRLYKQNQNLRLRLKRDLEKKSISTPSFIDRLNEQIHSSTISDQICIPNIDVLLQLAIKLRTIVLYLLETSKFDDLENALKRLNTLKHLVNQYKILFATNTNILVAKQYQRPLNININIEEWLNKSKSSKLKCNIIRYTDDSQLIAFTEVRFKRFENECRWIELNWHEQMIYQFKQTISNTNFNPLQIYRELMSLVTGLQTSTPIVVENKHE